MKATKPLESRRLQIERRSESHCSMSRSRMASKNAALIQTRLPRVPDVDEMLYRHDETKRFTEHDLRAKAGSDEASLEKARALLQHADSRTTLRIYRRRPEVV